MCHISASHRLKYIQAQPCGTTCASWINTRYPGTTPRSILEPVDSHLNKQLVSADDHLNEVLQTFFPSPLSLSVAHAVVIYLQKWHEEKKKSHSARPHENVLLNAHYCKFRFYFYCKGWKVLESYFLFFMSYYTIKTRLKIFMTKANRDFF